MNNITLFCQPGFQCSSEGDMLGLKRFNEALLKDYSDIDNYAKCNYDQITPDYFKKNQGHFNIGIFHSYGGGWGKKSLDAMPDEFIMHLAIWLDPVKDFWKGQFRWFPWSQPKCVRNGTQFFQKRFPPTGCPFSASPNIETINVTSDKIYHADMPGNPWIQSEMRTRIDNFLAES